MVELVRSPISAPLYAYHRELIANDTLPITVENHGINMAGYADAHIQVTPTGGDNPSIQVQFWNEEAGEFVDPHSAYAYAGKGANIPYEITVPANGRILHVAVVAGSGVGKTVITVSGFGMMYR